MTHPLPLPTSEVECYKRERLIFIRAIGLASGALKVVHLSPSNFNKAGLENVLKELDECLSGAGEGDSSGM